jgi:hypothetical protein
MPSGFPVPSPPGWLPASGPKSSAPEVPVHELAETISEWTVMEAATAAAGSFRSALSTRGICGSLSAEAAPTRQARSSFCMADGDLGTNEGNEGGGTKQNGQIYSGTNNAGRRRRSAVGSG